MRTSIRNLAIVAAAGLVSAAGWTGTAEGHHPYRHAHPTLAVSSELRDLQPATSEPLDGARSRLRMTVYRHVSRFDLRLRDIDPAAAGRRFGAHLHLGPCVAGNGAAALGHYNTDVLAGRTPVVADPTTEVWLDFTVGDSGTAHVRTWVPFAVQPGDRSIVIHAEPTAPGGAAGGRLACLPVVW